MRTEELESIIPPFDGITEGDRRINLLSVRQWNGELEEAKFTIYKITGVSVHLADAEIVYEKGMFCIIVKSHVMGFYDVNRRYSEKKESMFLETFYCFPTVKTALMKLLTMFGFNRTAERILKIPEEVGIWTLLSESEDEIVWERKVFTKNKYFVSVQYDRKYDEWILSVYDERGQFFDIIGEFYSKPEAIAHAVKYMSE